ncbi:hypothetical protein RchiOBHm_Chr2g0171161 [Rosa chinensis]|uniref:Uncharacterized protein n=1 Tax=Rosa chinensis TaxID=74649 RepID=A0A2P6S596_ROSCH|nr:hypothetical protein RchiOBHm_Chr2g0171161 [Rosa chinensis]
MRLNEILLLPPNYFLSISSLLYNTLSARFALFFLFNSMMIHGVNGAILLL